MPRIPHKLARTTLATTLVKCSSKQFPYSLDFNTFAMSFSLFACRIVNEYGSFQVVCKQPSLEFVRHFELSRETADHNLIPTITTRASAPLGTAGSMAGFRFVYVQKMYNDQHGCIILSDLFEAALKGMSFQEKAKVFVNTFQDFTRDQQNEVLKEILLKCQVCKVP